MTTRDNQPLRREYKEKERKHKKKKVKETQPPVTSRGEQKRDSNSFIRSPINSSSNNTASNQKEKKKLVPTNYNRNRPSNVASHKRLDTLEEQ